MPRPAANTAWFTCKLDGGPEFELYSFQGREKLSEPFQFSLELINTSADIDLTSLLGLEALLTIRDRSGGKRLVHGVVSEAWLMHSANKYTHYKVILRPRFYFIGKNREHRIFQNKSVVEIIQQILKEQMFTGDASDFQLSGAYPSREYCTQYAESDAEFINRLCEEEGIFYFFTHSKKGHCICFRDTPCAEPINGLNVLKLQPALGAVTDTAVLSHFALRQEINSDSASYKEWNFERVKLDLAVNKNEPSDEKAPAPPGVNLEHYQFPHLYQERGEGERYAQIQLLRQLTFNKWGWGRGDVARLTPGQTFTLEKHQREDCNRSWQVVSVSHKGEQPQVLKHEAPSERGTEYEAAFEVLPDDIRFVPAIKHPKKLVPGDQTAIVSGPKGEEIYPDKHGRVKVQFFFDREGKWDEKTSCWIRVSQSWAGGQYGTMAVPRVGNEVVVSFLEGDPDRPIITGRVYHGLNTPPYELPAHKARSVFKSLSSPGGGGFNELRIEDKKGEEEIYSHAEKDVNVHVKNDWEERILNDQNREIDNFSYSLVKQEDQQIVEQARKTELKDEDHITVHQDFHSGMNGKWLAKAGEEIHLESLLKAVVEAGADLTIKAGPSFVRLTPAGVYIVGPTVKINSGGAPGEGTPAVPFLPEEALMPGKGKVPKPAVIPDFAEEDDIPSEECMVESSDNNAPFC